MPHTRGSTPHASRKAPYKRKLAAQGDRPPQRKSTPQIRGELTNRGMERRATQAVR